MKEKTEDARRISSSSTEHNQKEPRIVVCIKGRPNGSMVKRQAQYSAKSSTCTRRSSATTTGTKIRHYAATAAADDANDKKKKHEQNKKQGAGGGKRGNEHDALRFKKSNKSSNSKMRHQAPHPLAHGTRTTNNATTNTTKIKDEQTTANATSMNPRLATSLQQQHKKCKYCDCQSGTKSSTYLIDLIKKCGHHRQIINPETLRNILKCPIQRQTIAQTDYKGFTALAHAIRHQKHIVVAATNTVVAQSNNHNNNNSNVMGGAYNSLNNTVGRWFEMIRLLVLSDDNRTSLFQNNHDTVMTPLMECIDGLLHTKLPLELYQATLRRPQPNNGNDHTPSPTFQELFQAFSFGLSMNAKLVSSSNHDQTTFDTLRFLIRETYLAACSSSSATTSTSGNTRTHPSRRQHPQSLNSNNRNTPTSSSGTTATPSLLHMFLHLVRLGYVGTIRRMEPFFPYQVLLPIYPISITTAVVLSIMEQYPHMIQQVDSNGNTPLHIIFDIWSTTNSVLRQSNQSYEAAYTFAQECCSLSCRDSDDRQTTTVEAHADASVIPNQTTRSTSDLRQSMWDLITTQGEPYQRILQELLDRYPEGARQYNLNGDLPLHVALNTRPSSSSSFTSSISLPRPLSWHRDGLDLLFRAYPKSLTIPSTSSGLLPFMMATAACSNKSGMDADTMNTIYHLLREDPSVMNMFCFSQ